MKTPRGVALNLQSDYSDTILCLYNVAKKEMIGIFRNDKILIKYFICIGNCNKTRLFNCVYDMIRIKSTCQKGSTPLNLRLTIRTGKPEHIEKLEDKTHILLVDYIPQVTSIYIK